MSYCFVESLLFNYRFILYKETYFCIMFGNNRVEQTLQYDVTSVLWEGERDVSICYCVSKIQKSLQNISPLPFEKDQSNVLFSVHSPELICIETICFWWRKEYRNQIIQYWCDCNCADKFCKSSSEFFSFQIFLKPPLSYAEFKLF